VKQSARASLAALAAGAVAALAVASPAAAATGFDLSLTGSTTAVVGQPVVLKVVGNNPPPADYWFTTWLQVDLLRPSAVPTCPSDPGAANQLATGTGGAILTLAQREDTDAAGHFEIPLGFTPAMTGPLLLCAYSYDDVGFPLAAATMTVTVSATTPPPAAPAKTPRATPAQAPANVAPPQLKRAGRRLVCRPGSWANDPSGYSYGWRVDGARKRGASAAKLRVTRALRGRSVQCKVTATNAAGSASAVSRRLRVR
jgi:hypothetical protein